MQDKNPKMTSWKKGGLPMKFRRLCVLTIALGIVCVAFLGSGLAQAFSPEAAAMREAARKAGVPEIYLPRETPAESRANKLNLDLWQQKITTMVRDRLAILEEEGVLRDGRRKLAPQFSTETVQIDMQARLRVECKVDDVTPFDESYFESIGGELVVRAIGYGLLVAWIPAERMEAFAGRPDVRLIMHINPPFVDMGSVVTEGDTIHRADEARADFDISGMGQFVGAISNGVDNMAASQGSGDLPPIVVVPPGCAGSGDEGTAMLEIIYDLAPGAGLAFCTGHPGMASMINAINTLAALPGMTIITDDLPKPGEPLFEDGLIAQAKQNAVAAGIFYTASAGNRGNQHYEENFNSTAANVPIGPNVYDNPHDFGGADFQLSITLGTDNSIYLQWADPFGSSGIDLDLYILDAAGNILASSTDLQNGAQDPNEAVSFGATAGTQANILVDYVGGGAPPTVFFDLRAFGGVAWNEYLIPEGSMNGASRQAEVYAAGASDAVNPTVVRGFSSRGPIRHFFPAPLTRMKPDAVAVNGVSITGAGGFGSGTCPMVVPGDCRFYGTSASTPHVAGLAALMLEACPGLTPVQVADFLNTTAVDIDAPGRDNNAGYGLLDVFAGIFPPVGFLEDVVSNEFNPPDPWVQEGLVVDTVCLVTSRNLFNLHFFSDPLQCEDVLCEPGDVKKIHEDVIQFVPDEIAYVPAGETLCVELKMSIPIGQHAGTYAGIAHAIAETFECMPKITDDFVLSLDVRPTVDVDVDDNHGNVSNNVMHLKGAKETVVSGIFTVVNPNSEVKNVDLADGPGNIRIEPVSVSSTDLVKIGDPGESIPAGNISIAVLSSLASGEAQDVRVEVTVPGGVPVNALYRGTVTVTYDECVHASRPNRHILGAGPVSDEFALEVHVLPTQGDLELVLKTSEDFCPDPFPDPWVLSGQVGLSFDVTAHGDHRNIRISSGGLRHDSLDNKLDCFNFFPEEIAFLPAGETRTMDVIVEIPIGQHEGTYEGTFEVVSENGGESEALVSTDVCDNPDMDVDDNHANVSDNLMNLRGAKNDTVSGAFTVVNPNSQTMNVDLPDGPGNVGISPVSISSTDLLKVGGIEVIPEANITFDPLNHLGSGESEDYILEVIIPGDIPINAVYMGWVTVIYEGDFSPFPEVIDSFGLKVEVFPTQGPLDIIDTSLVEEFCPPDPWTQVGQIEFSFEVAALGDHRNIRVSSGGLKHDSLDKKLDDFNFFPEEIAFLAAGETRDVDVIAKVPIGQHAGTYKGVFRVVSENGGEDSVFATAEVCVHPDLDIEDNLANLASNVMHLEGPKEGIAYGTFSLVNPNCTESNTDRYDGPGNLALENLIAIPSDLWFAAGGPPPKKPIPASMIDIQIYPDASHLPSGAGAYGIVQVNIPKKSEHWVPGYNFEYWGDVEVRGYVSGDSVSDGFKIELRVLKAIGGSLLSGFWGEQRGHENLLHWSELGLLESGYSLYRNDLKIADLGEGVFEYADHAVSTAAHEYMLGVKVGGSEIMLGPIIVGGRPVPAIYSISQNHPNPSRGTTTIGYQIPVGGHVSLKVYDISGRLVRTLEDGMKQAGFHYVDWNGEDDSGLRAGNGVYFYRMVSADFSKNLKMILLH